MYAPKRTFYPNAQVSFYLSQEEFLAKQDLVYEAAPTLCWALQENIHYSKAPKQRALDCLNKY